MKTEIESYCRERIASSPNMLVPWWIMAAWVYDQRLGGDALISDALFDEIADRLDREWETITHRHKHLLQRAYLKSALAIRGRWPLISMDAAESLLRKGPPGAVQPMSAPSPRPSQMELF